MAILSHCLNPCFTTCIFGSVYWLLFNLFPVMERQQRDNRETTERQQRDNRENNHSPYEDRGERETTEREQRLKRDPNPGSGHIIALGRLNHWGECCQMLRNI
jgi:hypothetical protein